MGKWNDLRLGIKLIIGFLIVVILAGVVGFVGLNGLSTVNRQELRVDAANSVVSDIKEVRKAEKNFIIYEDFSYLTLANNHLAGIYQTLQELRTGATGEELVIINEVEDATTEYDTSFQNFVAHYSNLQDSREDMIESAGLAEAEALALRENQKEHWEEDLIAFEAGTITLAALAERKEKADDANRLIKYVSELRIAEKNFLIRNDMQYATEFNSSMAAALEQVGTTKSEMKRQVNRDLADRMAAAMQEYNTAFEINVSTIRQKEELRIIIGESGSTVAGSVTPGDEYYGGGALFALQAKNRSQAAYSLANIMIIAFLVFAVLAGLGIGWFLQRVITNPINKVAKAADLISQGDIDVSVDVYSKDETGQLADSMRAAVDYMREMAQSAKKMANRDLTLAISPKSERDVLGNAFRGMIENIRVVVTEIQEAGNVLAIAVNQMMASSTQIASSVSETATTVSEATTTAEETRQTAEVANQKARAVSEAGKKAEQAAQAADKSVADTMEGMNRIREQMESVAETIVRLSEQSLAIGEIVNTVNGLADQSNLLAVNAAIEAAKAGEAGKGFVVVAQEVKNLADQSKQATVEVRQILSEIQRGVSTAVMATEQGTKAVEAGVQQSSEAATAIRSLSDTITESAQAGVQIGVSSQQQIIGMEQMVVAMETIKEASAQNAASARQLQKGAQDLQEMGKNLSQLVTQFKV